MNQLTLIQSLTEQGRLWRAKEWQQTKIAALSTGYSALDNLLPGNGWPLGAITEILYEKRGIGELRLVLPALAQISQHDNRWQLWLNPPLQPNAPALQQWQLDVRRLLVSQARNANDLCHSLEKSLQSGGCQGALVWVEQLDKALMRRIQLAAENSNAPVFFLRPKRFSNQPSVAALRIAMTSNQQIHILKRRAGWPINNIDIDLPLYLSN